MKRQEAATEQAGPPQPDTSGDALGYEFITKHKISLVYINEGKWQASMINKGFLKVRTANSPKMAIEAVFES